MHASLIPNTSDVRAPMPGGVCPAWPGTASYTFRLGVHELALCGHPITARQEESLRRGEAEFAFAEESPVLLFCYRFGEAFPWSVVPFDWQALPPRERVLPATGGPHEERALLFATLAESADATPRATRNVTFSLEFTRRLHQAIREHASLPFDPRERRRALDRLRRRYPTPETLVAHASARTIGSW
jgi:hypothetical protein